MPTNLIDSGLLHLNILYLNGIHYVVILETSSSCFLFRFPEYSEKKSQFKARDILHSNDVSMDSLLNIL